MKKAPFVKPLKEFFRATLRSLTDLSFFREVRNRPVSEVLSYLAVLLILTWLIPFAITFFIGVRATNDALISGLRKNVSGETKFTMKDGVFTTNLEEPLVLEKNGLTFIVNSTSSSLALSEDQVGIAINQDAIVQREGAEDMRVVSYEDVPDFELDRAGVDHWLAAFGPWIILLLSIATILAFSLVTLLGFGVFILLHAFILSFVLRLMKRPLPFTHAFIVAGYAATVPIIIKAVADWAGADLGGAPTYLYWILLGFIIYDFKKERQGEPEASENPVETKKTEK